MLHCSKSKEIIFTAWGKRAGKSGQLLTPCLDIKRVSSLRVLGVIVNDQLTATDHVFNILASCNSLLYALRILRSHDIPNTSLHDVFRATVIEKLTYCAPSWSGACSAPDRVKLESFVSRCKRLEYCSSESQHNQRSYWRSWRYTFQSKHDQSRTCPTTSPARPSSHPIPYSLRQRTHSKTLLNKSTHLRLSTVLFLCFLYLYFAWVAFDNF